jgi:hypothetical protein
MNTAQQPIAGAEERVAIIDLADELQIRKQTIFKVVKRLRIQTQDRRESARGNQKVATVTRLEATAITNELRQSRSSDSVGVSAPLNLAADFLNDEIGFYYLIQLEPEHGPKRFKVGFTTELQGRLRKHLCSAPFAKYVKHWLCRRGWERTATDCITDKSEHLREEVYRASSIDDVIGVAARFFALMPDLSQNSTEINLPSAG